MLKFKKWYFLLAIILFVIEVLIAIFIHDRIIRPYIGDFLVVIFICCFIKSFVDVNFGTLALSVLLFAYAIEVLQYLNFTDHLGMGRSTLARIVLGSFFEWVDILAYTLGILVVFGTETLIHAPRRSETQKMSTGK